MTAPSVASRMDAIHQATLPLTRLRALLLQELAEQAEQASECRTTMSILAGQTDADSLLEREIAETSENHAEEAIADIEHAIEKLDNGTYGTCERCGVAIPLGRLEAIPHARHCVDCTGQHAGLLG
jgi:RNA polymerase-binding transcription factor DksA